MRVVLTVAGSDSGAGAGVQADLKTFAAYGVYGACAITAVTAQSSRGVARIETLSADLVTAQIEAVTTDMEVHAAKTGMLPTAAIVEAVAASIAALRLRHLVVDPVMAATSGEALMDAPAAAALRTALLPRATVVTPNVPEAEALSGVRIHSTDDAREAARRIAALGPAAVVITGGHHPSPDVVDLLYDGTAFAELRHARVPGRHTHGTGCTFSAAVTAALALDYPLRDAVREAQGYVARAIAAAPGLGAGRGPLGHHAARPATPPRERKEDRES
jgi:hydroxymethylpyrimidine/phosphomethylpyrimidine kinase